MPRLVNQNPSYRHHKASDQAIVTRSGEDVYFGTYRSKQSRREYDRVIGEWLLPFLTPTTRAMVELQRLTGMRSGELCIIRTCDV